MEQPEALMFLALALFACVDGGGDGRPDETTPTGSVGPTTGIAVTAGGTPSGAAGGTLGGTPGGLPGGTPGGTPGATNSGTTTGDSGSTTTGPVLAPNAVADFALPDLNPGSPRYTETVSPRDYLGQVSGWYFIHAT